MVDVEATFREATGFVSLLGPAVVSTSREKAVLRLDAGPELHNHIGGPHAAVIFGLGESSAYAVLVEVFGSSNLTGVQAATGPPGGYATCP